DLIDAELARGRPVVTLIEDRPGAFHYVVVVASTPEAIVFHDPARASFQVMERERFAQRWSHASRWMAVIVPGAARCPSTWRERARCAQGWPRGSRWMAVIVPGEPSRAAEPPPRADTGDASSCASLISAGVQHAQAGEFDAAERNLTTALSCGGSEALRELAGLRLLQRRYTEEKE